MDSLPITPVIDLCIRNLESPLQMQVHGPQDKHVSRKIREENIWEPFETSLVQAALRRGGVFVDVGANIGYFTVVAASIVGHNGKVFAFEPDPENFSLLHKNCELNSLRPQVHAVRAGLSVNDAEGQLFLSEDNLGDHQIYSTGDGRKYLDIRLLNGTEYLRSRLALSGLSHIDLIKVDTQGSEYDVMVGLIPLLKELTAAPTILIELTPLSLRKAGASGRALIELLATLDQGFWIVDHIEHRLVRSSAAELAKWCDNVDASKGDEGFMNILLGGSDFEQ